MTSGIDFGLIVAEKIRDRQYAEMLQLVNEYDPQPPFHAGSAHSAPPAIFDHLRRMMAPRIEATRAIAIESGRRLRHT
ncbi:MAG: hypothetical protein JO189_32700 [Deltaproteobacteria bacterium]|nr:hypothetical protein [Deltaproteobacteria bacterium]